MGRSPGGAGPGSRSPGAKIAPRAASDSARRPVDAAARRSYRPHHPSGLRVGSRRPSIFRRPRRRGRVRCVDAPPPATTMRPGFADSPFPFSRTSQVRRPCERPRPEPRPRSVSARSPNLRREPRRLAFVRGRGRASARSFSFIDRVSFFRPPFARPPSSGADVPPLADPRRPPR